MEKKDYLEHRFVRYESAKNEVRFNLECKKSDKWVLIDSDIVCHYALYDRVFYKKHDKEEVWWMCEIGVMMPECLGKRYFGGAFFCMHDFYVSFFTQDASFKRIVYHGKIVIDYDRLLLFCRKENKYDVYRIEYYPDFEASCCLVLRFGTPSEILSFYTSDGQKLYLRSRLNPDKTIYWQEVDVRPWYVKVYQRIKKALA